MRRSNTLDNLKAFLLPGQVYRRSDFSTISSNVDRHLGYLVSEGYLIKLSQGLYSVPKNTPFGEAPPNADSLLRAFLKDDHFVVYSFSQFNSLGLGTTQLYNQLMVFNRKRVGEYSLGGRTYKFHRWREAPKALSLEFLVVELLNRLDNLAEDRDLLLENLKNKLDSFNKQNLSYAAEHYGTISTQKKAFHAYELIKGLIVMSAPFLHELENFKDLIEITANREAIQDPSLVEKDYWIMHVLWSLQQLKLKFHLKGGTSLSKGYKCIHRFSEDIDIKIEPEGKICGFKVYTGKNHDDKKHRDSRLRYFDWIANYLGERLSVLSIFRDLNFDDKSKNRNGGIRISYHSLYGSIPGLKDGILLEVGFDRTTPNQPCLISSWAFEHAHLANIVFADNRAQNVACYEPRYTFVEKLQAVIRKFRLYKEGKVGASLPGNFIRHYYDLYQMIDRQDVRDFIGTPEYEAYKKERFGTDDCKVANSDAFILREKKDRDLFEKEYVRSASLYFKGRPTLSQILERISKDLDRL